MSKDASHESGRGERISALNLRPDARRGRTRGIGGMARRTPRAPPGAGCSTGARCSVARGGRGEVRKRAHAHRGEQRRAVRRPLFAIHRAHRKAEHVALQSAAAKPTRRAAAGEEHMVGQDAELLENRHRVAEREAHAFDHGARDVRARVREAQAEDRAAHRRVAMRRSLALEIRQERHAIRAGRNGHGFGVEPLVRLAGAREVARELVAIPGERAARRENDAHQVPDAWHDVAERVRAQRGIDARLGHRREDRARRPPARYGFARRHRADAGRAARVVRTAADDRRARRAARSRPRPRPTLGRASPTTRRRRARRERGTFTASSISVLQRRCAVSYMSVADASDGSVATTPVSLKRMKSFGSITVASRANASGS